MFTPWFNHCSLIYFLLILVTAVFAVLTSLNVIYVFLKVMRKKVRKLAFFLQKVAILLPENLFYSIIISNLAKYV